MDLGILEPIYRKLPITVGILRHDTEFAIFTSAVGTKPHGALFWNAELQEWYCVKCGRTSDHGDLEDAKIEVDLFSCELPTVQTNLMALR